MSDLTLFDESTTSTENTELQSAIYNFWGNNSNGQITTEIGMFGQDELVIKVNIYRSADDIRPTATGYGHVFCGEDKGSHIQKAEKRALHHAFKVLGTVPLVPTA